MGQEKGFAWIQLFENSSDEDKEILQIPPFL
jgi:hypothetical protein